MVIPARIRLAKDLDDLPALIISVCAEPLDLDEAIFACAVAANPTQVAQAICTFFGKPDLLDIEAIETKE